MSNTELEIRLLIRHQGTGLEWKNSGPLDLKFAAVPRAGEYIDADSAKRDHWYEVNHVLHKPNATGIKIYLYVTVVDPPPDLYPTKV